MKTALITGITGQDGSYLAELLLGKGYRVVGLMPRRSNPDVQTAKLAPVIPSPDFILESGDLTDGGSLARLVRLAQPDEVYNSEVRGEIRATAADLGFPITPDQVEWVKVAIIPRVRSVRALEVAVKAAFSPGGS